ncbi:MAG: nucleotidyl transferase AbiEii/AbiGii toxin family protein [Mesorhizobium sp.]|uniref:nucleotidyl transferase AbiEii/AbiGii toxin family protein n=1 Tax=Mesorhizobium sp. TaxID=1871066 RepID=UPI000FE76604|nr:nucleotidyl transferase AbiEii/AbiGii toxin family protein [Mesorhizobium sp.]RWB32221.1 MAG: nucleotidyl transferase AbiEii/AbiGii toxin family protein [Mesorhizobium sp.]RWB79891.1 MAG: nucleotidyl transferase AbiEii/AbiGii toxin family protein [Mesorhizobium sp.]TIS68534.1 MAG: nucleotidyl transferase AbiEii/AbiGii toxin family protein [Mesorhizobium sp.]
MDKVARLPPSDRAALFGETGAGRGVANTIIEKDFWVCWTLKRLFDLPENAAANLVFKGGTSLSKAFGIIRRFSEDIDLSFDRADLGYTGDRDPEKEGISRKRARQLIDELVGDVEKHIADRLLPALRAAIIRELGEPQHDEWSLSIDAADSQTLNFHYPAALPAVEYQGMAYITPRVKLELGARGDPWPAEKKIIRPYAAEDFPDFFKDPDATITVLSARRTFWEKATALHAEANRPEDSATPQYFSRHYYDVAMLLGSDEGKAAAADLELLAAVAKHKATFFRSGWANYDAARPGTLRLMPSEVRIKDLRADYRAMAPMMFDDTPPSFADILSAIEKFQEAINR